MGWICGVGDSCLTTFQENEMALKKKELDIQLRTKEVELQVAEEKRRTELMEVKRQNAVKEVRTTVTGNDEIWATSLGPI